MHILEYVGFELQSGDTIQFTYSFGPRQFTITVQCEAFAGVTIPPHLIDHYGLALSLYWFNAEDFDEIRLKHMQLSPEQVQFFEWYFVHGMAEHRYTNGLPPDKPIKITPTSLKATLPATIAQTVENSYLCMIGGGKDSLVGLEVLNKLDVNQRFLGVNTNYPSRAVLRLMQAESLLIDISVKFSPSRADARFPTKFKGHKPGSSFWAFASTLAAYATGTTRVAVANEHSANFAQIQVGSTSINHQFSKSLEFEEKFTKYAQTFLLSNYTYFSIVRPLYEIQIAKMFADMPQYHRTFISCNISYAEGKWCKECAKCAFVYAILAPFLTKEQITDIWGGNLYEKESICKHVCDLASDNISPLECVGTPQETSVALRLAGDKNLLQEAHPRYRSRLEMLAKHISSSDIAGVMGAYMSHAIPSDIAGNVKTIIQNMLQAAK